MTEESSEVRELLTPEFWLAQIEVHKHGGHEKTMTELAKILRREDYDPERGVCLVNGDLVDHMTNLAGKYYASYGSGGLYQSRMDVLFAIIEKHPEYDVRIHKNMEPCLADFDKNEFDKKGLEAPSEYQYQEIQRTANDLLDHIGLNRPDKIEDGELGRLIKQALSRGRDKTKNVLLTYAQISKDNAEKVFHRAMPYTKSSCWRECSWAGELLEPLILETKITTNVEMGKTFLGLAEKEGIDAIEKDAYLTIVERMAEKHSSEIDDTWITRLLKIDELGSTDILATCISKRPDLVTLGHAKTFLGRFVNGSYANTKGKISPKNLLASLFKDEKTKQPLLAELGELGQQTQNQGQRYLYDAYDVAIGSSEAFVTKGLLDRLLDVSLNTINNTPYKKAQATFERAIKKAPNELTPVLIRQIEKSIAGKRDAASRDLQLEHLYNRAAPVLESIYALFPHERKPRNGHTYSITEVSNALKGVSLS